jgi:CRP/FNR family transcriptional regulator, anaerobic regulatory protein
VILTPIEIFIQKIQAICPDITDDELREFEVGLTVKQFKRKESIFEKEKPHNQIVYLISGLVRSFYIDEKGSEISAYFVKEFDFVSDYPAFLKDIKSNYHFEALENTTAIIIPKSLILKAYNTSAKFERFGRLIAEEAVQFLQGRVESFIFKSATERYNEFMNEENALFNRLSVEHIATYLGIERQSLTRIRKKLNSK